MAILSERLLSALGREVRARCGASVRAIDLGCAVQWGADPLGALPDARRRRDVALQASVNTGGPQVFRVAPSIGTWLVAVEDRRRVHGGLMGEDVWLGAAGGAAADAEARAEARDYLVARGLAAGEAERLLARLPAGTEARLGEIAQAAREAFYRLCGWQPELMEENRMRILQQQQFNRAIEEQKRAGSEALYAFEKERLLLANIRAGDRHEARRILNEMLAAIYMSAPGQVVLRARAVELVSCLTRAAIEDNPLLEPLIERNHAWTEQLIRATGFEELSRLLMSALDDFIDGVYLHGGNRTSARVQRAQDYISAHFAEPIGVADVARAVGLSASRLSHLVKEHTGKTVIQIVLQARIRQAQRLLERTDRSGAEIAYEVGFGDQSYFIKQFRRLTGVTPARFRRVGG